jgi:hypothetical protein
MTDEQPDATTEARLRAALASRAAHVDAVTTDPGPLPLQARAAPVSLLRRHPTALAGLVAAAAAVLVLGVVVVRRSDRTEGVVATGGTTTTVAPVAPTTSAATTVPAPTTTGVQATVGVTKPVARSTTTAPTVDASINGWPGRGSTRYPTARAAGQAFVKSVLGFAQPTFKRSTSETVPVGSTAAVTFTARPTAGAETTVTAIRTGPKSWLVRGATSNQGTIASSTFGKGRIDVSGTGTAFEATLTIRALSLSGGKLGEDIAMGGANGEPGPYRGGVSYTGGPAAFVLVGEGDASGAGDLVWACVVLDPALR